MPLKKTLYFIVNPISGARKNDNFRAIVKDNLDHDKYDYQYHETQRRGHASELASYAKDNNIDIVVACGGDGTVNEVASAIQFSDTALAIIPRGSGNGFAMHIGMGRDSKKAILKLSLIHI